MNTLLGPALALLIAFSSSTTFAQSGGERVEFDTIVLSGESAIKASRDEVIIDEVGWARFWEELYPDPALRPPLPEVDFSRRMVVVVSMGAQPTVGFEIRVTKLMLVKGSTEGRTLLEVVIEETRPKPSCFQLPSATAPVHVIETELMGDVTFRRLRLRRCGGE